MPRMYHVTTRIAVVIGVVAAGCSAAAVAPPPSNAAAALGPDFTVTMTSPTSWSRHATERCQPDGAFVAGPEGVREAHAIFDALVANAGVDPHARMVLHDRAGPALPHGTLGVVIGLNERTGMAIIHLPARTLLWYCVHRVDAMRSIQLDLFDEGGG